MYLLRRTNIAYTHVEYNDITEGLLQVIIVSERERKAEAIIRCSASAECELLGKPMGPSPTTQLCPLLPPDDRRPSRFPFSSLDFRSWMC